MCSEVVVSLFRLLASVEDFAQRAQMSWGLLFTISKNLSRNSFDVFSLFQSIILCFTIATNKNSHLKRHTKLRVDCVLLRKINYLLRCASSAIPPPKRLKSPIPKAKLMPHQLALSPPGSYKIGGCNWC